MNNIGALKEEREHESHRFGIVFANGTTFKVVKEEWYLLETVRDTVYDNFLSGLYVMGDDGEWVTTIEK
jgi:hypothetical protein